MTDEVKRITDYLSNGGLFNPEYADHVAVRDLLIDCRIRIEELEAEVEKLKQLLNDGHSSLLKENEQLRWKCAAQESYEWLSRKQND